jgi:hypothetical protein
MKSQLSIIIVMFMVVGLAAMGCDVGINPLVLDGSVTAKTFHVNTTGGSFQDADSINLGAVRDAASKTIDSLKFYNLTILIDSTDGTPANAKISGSIRVDGNILVALSNVPISAFSSERSIFDPTLTGVSAPSPGVVNDLKTKFADGETVLVEVDGSSVSSPLNFYVHVKIYGQLFTEAK